MASRTLPSSSRKALNSTGTIEGASLVKLEMAASEAARRCDEGVVISRLRVSCVDGQNWDDAFRDYATKRPGEP